MDNHEFRKELIDNLINEMGAMVDHHFNGVPKSGNYLLVNEFSGAASINFSDNSNFNPFGHVVRGYYDVSRLVATSCWLDWANVI